MSSATYTVTVSSEQAQQAILALRLRRAELERHNPNMRVPALDAVFDLEQDLIAKLSGIPSARPLAPCY